MANTNITLDADTDVILDVPLWAGQGGLTQLNADGSVRTEGDTSWLQSPIGSGTARNTCSLAIVDFKMAAGNAATEYDLTLATNPVVGEELVAVLGHYNTSVAAGRMAEGDHDSTTIKFAADAQSTAGNIYRVVFLYR